MSETQTSAGGLLERLSVKLPDGFDPAKHAAALPKAIAAKHGAGWEVEYVDMGDGVAVLVRQQAALMRREGLRIPLPAGTKPTDGERIAKRQAELNPGYQLARFEPHLGVAYLAEMSESELRCREAVATALRCKPWDVTCRQRSDGGYTLKLPGTYQPGRADDALLNVAENVVGRYGWYVKTDPMSLQCDIIPSDPPTFPPVVPFPFAAVKKARSDDELFSLQLAEGLSEPGGRNKPISMSLDDSNAVLVVGLPGSGKSVAVMSIVYQALVKGYRLAVIDTPAKKTDFAWAKPYVEDHWWGCDDAGTSVAEALTVATLLDEEGKRLGELLAEHGVGKWQDLPAAVKLRRENAPILVVADELANLLSKPTLPAGLTKEAKQLPEFVRMAQDYLEAKLLTLKLNALVAVHRAAGMRELYLTQRPSKTEGFPPELKSLIPHRVLLGPNPSESDVLMAFRDRKRIPPVPANVASDSEAARGAGIAHLDGSDPAVIKGFYAPASEFHKHLLRALGSGDPSDGRVRPTADQIARCVPRADGGEELEDDGEPPATVGEWTPSGKSAAQIEKETGIGPVVAFGDDGKRLSGAAAAARASKLEVAVTECPSCERPIAADGTCGCSW